MNKAAAKEPSMDEILSSIRQIIADDDAIDAPAAKVVDDDPIAFDLPDDNAEDDDLGPLELSTSQIVESDDEDEPFDLAGIEAALDDEDDSEFSVPDLVVPDDIAFEEVPEPEAAPPVSAQMPDPDLASDLAERLLEPATSSAVKNTFAKLGNASVGAHNLTIENMIREMLRPMLKDWLDENLPSVVEKMVEREIERLSRGS